MTNLATHIYVLSDGEKFYVGKADNVNGRYRAHTRNALNPESNEYYLDKSFWIRSYGSVENARRHIKILYYFKVFHKFWKIAEIKHIAYYRKKYGYKNVMNMTDGGEGLSGEDHPNSKLTWGIINHLRDSYYEPDFSILASSYNVPSGNLSAIIYNESWYDPDYSPPERGSKPRNVYDSTGENNGRAQLTWYHIFLCRKNYKPYGRDKESKTYASERLEVSKSMVEKISLNLNWYDPNWDPDNDNIYIIKRNPKYIGPPQNWEESWGDWR